MRRHERAARFHQSSLGRRGRGESNTPFPGQICTDGPQPAYKVAAVGVDQIRFVLLLSGECARFCESLTEHDYRPRGMPSMRMVGAWMLDGPPGASSCTSSATKGRG